MFIDTRELTIIKKKVRKLEDQLEYESRRWESWLVYKGKALLFLL